MIKEFETDPAAEEDEKVKDVSYGRLTVILHTDAAIKAARDLGLPISESSGVKYIDFKHQNNSKAKSKMAEIKAKIAENRKL